MTNKEALHLSIGRKIKFFRTQKGLNQEDLSKRVGLTRSSIAQIEVGKQALSIYVLYRIGEALSIAINEILPVEEFDSYSLARTTEKKSVLNIVDKKRLGIGK